MAIIKCPQCNMLLSANSQKCPKCGWEVNNQPTEQPKPTEQPAAKSKTNTLLWGIIGALIALIIVIIVATIVLIRNNDSAENDIANLDASNFVSQVDCVELDDSDYDLASGASIPGLYPHTSQRKIAESELYGMTARELKIMRNEIYARHGYIFQTRDMKEYFAAQNWYQPISSNVTLSQIEQRNVATIKAYENKLSSGSAPKISTGVGLYPFTSTRKLTHADVAYLSARELKIMRNEIYARHGYIFKTKDMKEYFARQSWYRPVTSNVQLSNIEQYNVNFIKSYE